MVDAIKAMISSPLDGATQEEMKTLIKTILVTFTTSYVKNYALALVKKTIDDAAADPGPAWKLQERPPRTEPFKAGLVSKEGGFLSKKFQTRYFVVRPDYMIDYYENEAEANKEKGKKKGTISLCGYYVNEDANNGILQRLTKLAEKMGIDMSGIPKPKEYPANTMELQHSRRQTYYIHLDDPEEFKKWVDQMRTCAWRAYGYKNKDEVHIAAFQAAVRDSRWKLGRWGYWSYGGTEEQILSDLISDEIDWQIMGRVYSKLNGAWPVRNALRNQVLKVIDKMVLAAVTPAWKAMSATVEKLRPEIEPKIKEVVGPIGGAKLEVRTKIQDACMSVISPILKENVTPHLSKIVEVIQSPVEDSLQESYKLFDAWISKFEPKGTADEVKNQFRDLDWKPWSWELWDATRKVDVMYDPLWALHIVFEDIYPWSAIWTAHDLLRKKTDNAIYTYEAKLLEEIANGNTDLKAASDKIKAVVLEDFKHDGQLARVIYFTDIIKKIVMPPFNKLVMPAVSAILDPLQSAIPEPMQQFLDINEEFGTILNNIIDSSIGEVLSG